MPAATATSAAASNGQRHPSSSGGLPCAGGWLGSDVARVDVLLRLLEAVPEIDGRLIPVDGVLGEAAMHQSRELTRDRGLELAHRARRVPQNRGDDGGSGARQRRAVPRSTSRRTRCPARKCPSAHRSSCLQPARATCTRESRRCVLPASPIGSGASPPRLEDSSVALARPKSSTLTRPSSLTMTLAGLRSRCVIPCWCAAASASARGIAISKNLPRREALSWQHLCECLPLHQFHRDEVHAAGLFDGVHGHDVGVVQRGDGLRFSREPGATLGVIGQLRRQDFEGHLAIERGVLGQIDVAHPTRADLLEDLVVGDGLADHLRRDSP